MKIYQKLILGFSVISLMVGVIGYISLIQLNKVAKPLNNNIPESIKTVAETSHLDVLAQLIRYYDEVLTQSARNYAFTQDKKWEQRFKSVEPKLDKIIKEALKKGDERDKEFFSSIDKANRALVKMEYKSFEFAYNEQVEKAVKILESRDYWDQKRIYEQGLRNYVQRRGVKYDEALLNSTKTIELATKDAQNLTRTSLQIVLTFTTVALIFAVGIGIYISRSISTPIKKLKKATVEIGKGNLDTKIIINTKDEIGQLSTSFNKMTEDLQITRDKLISVKDYKENIMKSMLDTLIVISPDTTIKTVNQAALRLLGYEENELIGKPISMIFTSEEELIKRTSVDGLIKEFSVYNVEKVYFTKDGRKIPVLFSGSTMNDDAGNIQGMVCIALDISKRKQMEEKLKNAHESLKATQKASVYIMEDLQNELTERKRTQEYLRQARKSSEILIQSSLDMIISVDVDRNIVTFNRAAEETFGYTTDEVLGKNVEMLYADLSQYLQVHNIINDTGKFKGEVLNKKKNGDIFTIQLFSTVLHDDKDKIIGFMGISRDITEQKQMEEEMKKLNEALEQRVDKRTLKLKKVNEELRQEINKRKQVILALRDSKEMLQAIMDNTTAVIYLKDTKGYYIMINRQYETLFHITKKEITGKTDYDIFPKGRAKAFLENDKKVTEAGAPIEFEEIVPHDDGLHTYISIKFPLLNKEGVIYGVCGISTDITERKRREKQMTMYKMLFDNISDLVYICDTRGKILFVNKVFEKLSGHKPEEYFGKSFTSLFDKENSKKAMDVYKKTMNGDSPQYELSFKDTGILCEYKNSPLLDEKKNIIGVIGIAHKINQC